MTMMIMMEMMMITTTHTDDDLCPQLEQEHQGITPLVFASVSGRSQCVVTLLDLGADVNRSSADDSRKTPMAAVLEGCVESNYNNNGWDLAEWSERCASIPKITADSNPLGGSELTFRSDLLFTARGGST
jgi:ankyrin repeat protein